MPPDHEWVRRAVEERQTVLRKLTDPEERHRVGFCHDTRRVLVELKQSYIADYIALHSRARLGANDDRRKERLLHDERLAALTKLSTIQVLSHSRLIDIQDRLADLKSCFALTEQQLQDDPVCPHCSFRPGFEETQTSAGLKLSRLEEELDELVEEWTQTLLASLEDPTTTKNLELLAPEHRQLIDEFLQRRTLPESITQSFIDALREALSGLVKVIIKPEELRVALLKGGSPVTVREMKERFETFLDELTRGKDPSQVRIVLE